MAQPPIVKAKIKDRPSLRGLANFVVPRANHKWYNLGLQLFDSKDVERLNSMRANLNKSPDDHCLDVLIHWLSTKENATWHKLLKALKCRSVNLPNVANDIENLLDSHSKSVWSKANHKIRRQWIKGDQSIPEYQFVSNINPETSLMVTSFPVSTQQQQEESVFYDDVDSSDPDESDAHEISLTWNQRSALPRSMSQQYYSSHDTQKRSASVNENQLSCNMKAHSSSELNQPNNGYHLQISQGFRQRTPVPKPRSIKPLSQAAENSVTKLNTTEKHQNSRSDLPTDDCISLKTSHKADYANLQQQLDSNKSSSDAKSEALENSSIVHHKQQLDGTENSLTEKTAKIQNSMNDSTAEHQQQLDSTEGSKNTKFQAFENSLKESTTHLQQQIDELKSGLSQVLEKSDERDKENKMVIKKLQEDVIQMQKERKSEYNQNETETYKIQIEAEKQKAAEAQEALKQVSDELQKALKERLHTEQRLKEQYKSDYDSKITKLNKEIQKYKKLCDAEKQSTVEAKEALTQASTELQEAKEALTQVSTELQEKAQETQVLKKKQDESQSTIQKLENTLRDFKMQKYKNLSDVEKKDTVTAQETLMKVSAKLQEKENKYLGLEQSHNKLLCAKQNIEKELQDVSKQYELRIKEWEDYSNKHLQAEKENATKKLLEVSSENTNLRELQSALQDKNTSLLQEKENLECAIKSLQDENDMLKTTVHRQLIDSKSFKEPLASPLPPKRSSSVKPRAPPSQNSDQPGQISKTQDIRKASSFKILTKKPNRWDLKVTVIPKIMSHWKEVALHALCYSASTVATIEEENSNATECCFALFENWLRTNNRVTWETLLTQLREVEELGDKVEEIMKELIK